MFDKSLEKSKLERAGGSKMSHDEKTVLAMGFFDGLHMGHAELLQTAKRRARELGAKSAVLTFDSHPDLFVRHEHVRLINSAADRVHIIERFFGISHVFFLHFNEEMMRLSWRSFADDIIKLYNVKHFVVGHDFRFGFRGEGGAALLRDYCRERDIGCDIIPAVKHGGEPISSTRIRALIAAGEIERANELLGHPHLLTGRVRTGYRLGRTLCAPTINMTIPEEVLVSRHGVYAAKAIFDGSEHLAVLNVGNRPTFGGDDITVETNIFDFEGELYGRNVCVEFHSFLRPEEKFSGAAELMHQIELDIQAAREFFADK